MKHSILAYVGQPIIFIVFFVLAVFTTSQTSQAAPHESDDAYLQIHVEPSLRVYAGPTSSQRHGSRSLPDNTIVKKLGEFQGRIKVAWCTEATPSCSGWITNNSKYHSPWSPMSRSGSSSSRCKGYVETKRSGLSLRTQATSRKNTPLCSMPSGVQMCVASDHYNSKRPSWLEVNIDAETMDQLSPSCRNQLFSKVRVLPSGVRKAYLYSLPEYIKDVNPELASQAGSTCHDCSTSGSGESLNPLQRQAEVLKAFAGNVVASTGNDIAELRDRVRAISTPSASDVASMSPQERENVKTGLEAKLRQLPTESNVRRMISGARTNAGRCLEGSCRGKAKTKAKSKSLGYCLRYVKHALVSGGYMKTKGSWPGNYSEQVSAKYAGGPLLDLGFTNIKKNGINEYNAPKGAILVYSGGKHGHIEIKTGTKEYTSDYISSRPRSAAGTRRLIGVYVKM